MRMSLSFISVGPAQRAMPKETKETKEMHKKTKETKETKEENTF